jgi:hypothetical protein
MAGRALSRDRSLRVQVTTAELNMLHKIAAEEGITASDHLRLYIRRTYAARFGTPKTKRARA